MTENRKIVSNLVENLEKSTFSFNNNYFFLS